MLNNRALFGRLMVLFLCVFSYSSETLTGTGIIEIKSFMIRTTEAGATLELYTTWDKNAMGQPGLFKMDVTEGTKKNEYILAKLNSMDFSGRYIGSYYVKAFHHCEIIYVLDNTRQMIVKGIKFYDGPHGCGDKSFAGHNKKGNENLNQFIRFIEFSTETGTDYMKIALMGSVTDTYDFILDNDKCDDNFDFIVSRLLSWPTFPSSQENDICAGYWISFSPKHDTPGFDIKFDHSEAKELCVP